MTAILRAKTNYAFLFAAFPQAERTGLFQNLVVIISEGCDFAAERGAPCQLHPCCIRYVQLLGYSKAEQLKRIWPYTYSIVNSLDAVKIIFWVFSNANFLSFPDGLYTCV